MIINKMREKESCNRGKQNQQTRNVKNILINRTTKNFEKSIINGTAMAGRVDVGRPPPLKLLSAHCR
jgi:hypothetical protein